MKLKAKYDKIEDIPVEYRDLFEQRGQSEPGANDGKWVLINIEGLVTEGNVHKLEVANRKLREERDGLKEKVDAFGEHTADQFHTMEDKVSELEAQLASLGKPDDDKVNSLVEARIKSKLGPLERELKLAKDGWEIEKVSTTDLRGTISKINVHDAVRKAAEKIKVVPTAIQDLLMLSERVFEVVEQDGGRRVITRDGVGLTPGLSPEDWLTEIGPSRPHIFPPSHGAGSTGGGQGGGMNGDNPWMRANWNQTKQGEYIVKQGEDKAHQAAKAAGSSVGATTPPVAAK